MTSVLTPQVILITYWLIILVLAAFALRMACSLCRVDMPSWRRAFVSVLVVTFLTYLVFDFTCYLIMRSMDGVLLMVPPWYSYGFWFREPLQLKWFIVSHAGPLKYLPFVFGLCVAGVLQLIVLQAQVTFRFGLLIFLMQWGATFVAGYVVSLLFGVALDSIGWTPPEQTMAQAPEQAQPMDAKTKRAPPKGAPKARPKAAGKKGPEDGKGQAPAGGTTAAAPTALQKIEPGSEGAAQDAKDYLSNVGANLKAYADSHLQELKESVAPLTRHLPQPVQDFLDQGGWWLVLGVCAVLALLWVRLMVRKLRGVVRPLKRKRGKKRRARAPAPLRENLKLLGEGFTDVGPRRLVVKGVPARLRLVVLSMGTQGGGGLSEDMADRVLDWIKNGLAEVAAHDGPGVRVWPPFYSADGFATALQSNVSIPEPPGMKSHWVLMAGSVRMGRLVIHVGLLLHAEDANSLRLIKVKQEQWLDSLTIEKTPAGVW
jgi:hypothetical protein